MFFSVKSSVKIAGKVYTPCVCYPLPEVLLPTIEKMVAEGKAYKFDKKVYFQNGKVIESAPVVEETHTVEKPRKEKKTKEIPAKEFVKEADEVVLPSPEEIADNEDF